MKYLVSYKEEPRRKIEHELLAVARKNGQIEVLSPVNGDFQAIISDANGSDLQSENIVGLHLFAKPNSELAMRACTLLSCTGKGNASLRSIDVTDSSAESSWVGSSKTWNVCDSGNVVCCKVDGNEKFALFGGSTYERRGTNKTFHPTWLKEKKGEEQKSGNVIQIWRGVEVNIWDLDNYTKIWNAKSPPKDSLGIFTPTWFTSAMFLRKDDHRKFVAGTNSHQVRLYDISAQRRPVLSFDFRETAIKALAEDIDGYSIYVGNGSGDMASVDIRTGKLLGCFSGKCSGSIRSIVRHPELPVVASCGLDSYLRLWDTKTRQLLSSVFLKQHLMHVLFDSGFIVEEIHPGADPLTCKEQTVNETIDREEVERSPLKRKKSSRNKETSTDNFETKNKSKRSEERKKSKGNDGCKNIASVDKGSKSISKKRNKRVEGQ